MEILVMKSQNLKALLLIAACGWGLWKLAADWLGPAVAPGKVTILTANNFYEVRKNAGTLLAIYMRPG